MKSHSSPCIVKTGDEFTEADGSGEKRVRFTVCKLYLYRKEIASVQLTANTLNAHSGTNMKLSKHSDKACIIILPGLDKLLHLLQGSRKIIWWIHKRHISITSQEGFSLLVPCNGISHKLFW